MSFETISNLIFMKLIIFAGGIGTRLWPLSRENSPKQFDRIFNGRSTLELAIGRVAPIFGLENIFIQTQAKYKKIVEDQVPGLPKENIILEPERRNLGPAVCLAMLHLKKKNYSGPIAILWSDHLMERVEEFVGALRFGEKLIELEPNRFVFLGERPRFANNNLGWVRTGAKAGDIDQADYYGFAGWKYKPGIAECDEMYKSGEYFWNPGYFITSVDFLIDQYKQLAPGIFKAVSSGDYARAEKTHFDEAIIEKVDLSNAVVLKTNMGWSDPGTLYALKEALHENSQANVVKGLSSLLDTEDSLIYNLEAGKLIAGVGLKGMVIVNTPDALIVAPKNEVVKITKLIDQMKLEGLDKYL